MAIVILSGAQRGAVYSLGPYSLQAEGLGLRPRTVGVQTHSPGALGRSSRGPSTRGPWEGLSIWGAQGPSPSLRQVPELLCHQSKPHGCDPGPLGSSAAGRRGPQQPGECLGGDGQERDAGGYGHRWGVLSWPAPAGWEAPAGGGHRQARGSLLGGSWAFSAPELTARIAPPPPPPPCPTCRPQPALGDPWTSLLGGLGGPSPPHAVSPDLRPLCRKREGPGPLEAARGASWWPSRPQTRELSGQLFQLCSLFSSSVIDSPSSLSVHTVFLFEESSTIQRNCFLLSIREKEEERKKA